MDGVISFGVLGQVLQAYGPFGIIVVVWYFDRRDFSHQIRKQERYMTEMRQMYENNVELVKGYKDLAGDLKDIIVMNTEVITKQTSAITQNQYCPALRIEKKQVEVPI